LSWQVHSYGTISQPLIDWCKQNDLPLHRYTAKKDALYLVRPDGYIGWSGDTDDLLALIDYAARWGVIPIGG
jgi:hypothetical protein